MIFRPHAILWDLDGTIIDSTDCHFISWQAALEEHGFKTTREIFNACYGRNNQASIRIMLGFEPEPDLSKAIVHQKETFFRDLIADKASLVSGVTSWLDAAKEMGIKQAIASSAPMQNIIATLKTFNLSDYFDLLVSGAEIPAKPEPDVFLRTAEGLGFPGKKCLVIEDSTAGVEAAKRAGMVCIAVVTSHLESQLESADLIIDGFSFPLMDAIRKINDGV